MNNATDENVNALDEAVRRLNDQLATRLAELLGCAVRLDTERVLTEGDGEAPSRTVLTVDVALHLEEDTAPRRLTVRRSLPTAVVDALAPTTVAGLATELHRGSVAVVDEVNRLRGEVAEHALAVATSASTGPGVRVRGHVATAEHALASVGALSVGELVEVLQG